jgi:hypothetical protein
LVSHRCEHSSLCSYCIHATMTARSIKPTIAILSVNSVGNVAILHALMMPLLEKDSLSMVSNASLPRNRDSSIELPLTHKMLVHYVYCSVSSRSKCHHSNSSTSRISGQSNRIFVWLEHHCASRNSAHGTYKTIEDHINNNINRFREYIHISNIHFVRLPSWIFPNTDFISFILRSDKYIIMCYFNTRGRFHQRESKHRFIDIQTNKGVELSAWTISEQPPISAPGDLLWQSNRHGCFINTKILDHGMQIQRHPVPILLGLVWGKVGGLVAGLIWGLVDMRMN